MQNLKMYLSAKGHWGPLDQTNESYIPVYEKESHK